MATFPADKSVKTVEEEEVRTEEDESKEEDIESFLDSDPNNSALNLSIEDEESDEGIENQNPQEDLIAIHRSDQTMDHGSTSFASDQNRRLVPPNRYGAQMFQAIIPPEENLGLGASLVTQPPYQSQIPWSDQTMNQQQRFTIPNRENLGLGASLVTQPPYQSQIPWSDQTMSQQQRFTIPNRGLTSVAPVQNNFNHLFGMHQQPSPMVLTTRPRWFDHYYADGFGPHSALWRSLIVRPLLPNQTIIQRPAFEDQNTYQQHQMVMMQMLNQNIVPRPALVLDQNQSFGMLQQDHVVPHVAPVQAPMRPLMQQNQIVPNLLPGQNLMRPVIQQDQVVPNIVPGQAPMRPMMQHDQVVPNIFPGQTLMRPMMYNQEQDQIVPYLLPSQALMRPTMYNQEQNQIVPSVLQVQALMRLRMYNQDQIVPTLVTGQAPMLPMMYNQDQIVPSVLQVQALMRPRMYNQDQIVPIVVPNQALVRPMMNKQQQQFNQGQHFGLPIDMIHHLASPNAAAPAPRHELNHQQMQQLQPRTQQPTQSQRFNAGPSSGQSQHYSRNA